MRRIIYTISLSLVILLVLIWPYTIFTTKNCKISELNMSLQLPGNSWLLTKSSDRSGLPLDLYKILKQVDIDQTFEKNGIYLQAKYSDFEIQIDAFTDFGTVALFDLDILTDHQQQEVLASFVEQYQGQQLSLYKSPFASYIAIEYTAKKLGDSYTTKSYMTVKNGKLISIALLCPDRKSTSERTEKLKQIVDTIQYRTD